MYTWKNNFFVCYTSICFHFISMQFELLFANFWFTLFIVYRIAFQQLSLYFVYPYSSFFNFIPTEYTFISFSLHFCKVSIYLKYSLAGEVALSGRTLLWGASWDKVKFSPFPYPGAPPGSNIMVLILVTFS